MSKQSNPFALRLRRLRKPTDRRIYRFRRRVKALRAYLELYTFPSEAPTHPALDTLYQAAGKLRRAYLLRKAIPSIAPEEKPTLRKQLRKRKKHFLQVYKANKKSLQATLKRWRERYPLPKRDPSAAQLWEAQAARWVEALRRQALAFPEVPADAEAWHDLRRLLRKWELGAKWAPLPVVPPKALTQQLGDWRDKQALYNWLLKRGLSPLRLAPLKAEIQIQEIQIRAAWSQWRQTLASENSLG